MINLVYHNKRRDLQMNKSNITTENAPQYQKDLKQFVGSMTEDDWHGDDEDKSTEAVDVEKQWLHDWVDSMEPIEAKWLRDFVDSMGK